MPVKPQFKLSFLQFSQRSDWQWMKRLACLAFGHLNPAQHPMILAGRRMPAGKCLRGCGAAIPKPPVDYAKVVEYGDAIEHLNTLKRLSGKEEHNGNPVYQEFFNNLSSNQCSCQVLESLTLNCPYCGRPGVMS